ncbi:MAG: aldo/keto reductase family protein [Actinobacteria bacterium]|nr:aldo/keto reductase family protein [Actinomycetota bacterium]MCL5885873.1 aldo/keto reductase family protein [Actinomycetota bacterium]
MRYNHLGSSGLMVSALAYGNWLTHGAQIDEELAVSCVHKALDLGITTFDTADVYAATKAETVLGNALKGVRRESIVLCSKVYWPTGSGPNDRGLSAKHVIESCNATLRRLGTDYLDLYQAHRYDYETPVEEVMMAFDQLVRQGKVIYFGVSEWKATEIREANRTARELGLRRITSNQPQYSMLWRVIEKEVVPLCLDEGIGQIVWSPLAQGVLTGKYRPGEPPPVGSRATDTSGEAFISRYLNTEVLDAVARLSPIASDAGMTVAQMALAWVLSRPGISAAIVGATRPEQLEENVKAVEKAIDEDTAGRIDEALGSVVVSDPSLTQSPPTRP